MLVHQASPARLRSRLFRRNLEWHQRRGFFHCIISFRIPRPCEWRSSLPPPQAVPDLRFRNIDFVNRHSRMTGMHITISIALEQTCQYTKRCYIKTWCWCITTCIQIRTMLWKSCLVVADTSCNLIALAPMCNKYCNSCVSPRSVALVKPHPSAPKSS